MRRELWSLFKLTDTGRKLIVLLILRCPFATVHNVVQAVFLQQCFNAAANGSTADLYKACLLFGLFSAALFLYNGTVWTMFAAFVIRFTKLLRQKLFNHVTEISCQQMEARPSGEWFTRLNSDVQLASGLLNQPIALPHAVVSIVSIIASGTILITMNLSIFVLVIAFIIPHLLVSQLVIAKPMTTLGQKAQEAKSTNTTDFGTLITSADTALLYDAQGFFMKRFEESSLGLRRANMKLWVRNAMGDALLPMFAMSGYLLILFVGGAWISQGQLTFGDLTAAFQYRGGVLVGSIILINSLMSIKTSLAGVKRYNETLLIPAEEVS